MAVRKRELVVEQWCKHEREFGDYLASNPQSVIGMPDDELDAMFGEVLMAKGFFQSGMQVYEFDPDFTESILGESWSDLLPEVIDYIPHYGLYLKLPFNDTSEGIVVTLSEEDEIINGFMYDSSYAKETKGVYSIPGADLSVYVNTGERVVLIGGFAIPNDFGLMFDDTPLGVYPRELMLNALAYLCSTNADIAAVYSPAKERKRNKAKRRSQATWHEVGYRIGAELRNYNRLKSENGGKTGRKVRPHMRRAHWHRYWVGSGDEKRLVLKWVASTMVGMKNGEIESATGHVVRAG